METRPPGWSSDFSWNSFTFSRICFLNQSEVEYKPNVALLKLDIARDKSSIKSWKSPVLIFTPLLPHGSDWAHHLIQTHHTLRAGMLLFRTLMMLWWTERIVLPQSPDLERLYPPHRFPIQPRLLRQPSPRNAPLTSLKMLYVLMHCCPSEK